MACSRVFKRSTTWSRGAKGMCGFRQRQVKTAEQYQILSMARRTSVPASHTLIAILQNLHSATGGRSRAVKVVGGVHFARYLKLRPLFDVLTGCRQIVQTRSLDWDFKTQRCFQTMDLYDCDLLRHIRTNTASGCLGEVVASRFFYQVR